MSARFGLICLVAVVTLSATVGKADAQQVSFSSMNYTPAVVNPPKSATVAPAGTFNPPNYPNGDGGQFRVTVDYGVFTGGNFIAFPKNTPGIPNATSSAGVPVAKGGGLHQWSIPVSDCAFPPGAQCRARLERSTDGGTTWTTEATSNHTAP